MCRRKIKAVAIACAMVAAASCEVGAVSPSQVVWGDIANDTTTVTRMLVEKSGLEVANAGELMASIGSGFIGVPYGAGTLEGVPEELRVNLQQMDCMSFVETVAAMAMTVAERRNSWIDFVYNLERIRYRGGNLDGYASRLHYVSDWILDNSHRGIVAEVTDRIGNPRYQIKTLEFMTANRDKYPALADSTEFERLKSAQIGFRSHRYPYIRSAEVGSCAIKPGDIIAITTKTPGLDVSHVGIAVEVDGKIHLLHASSKEGKVCVSRETLAEYLHRNRNATGVRVVRLRD